MFPTDADALFAAVLARPADDLPRLVFADAIEETGHPAAAARAAYIRASVELARTADPLERERLQAVAGAARPGFADEVDVAMRAAELGRLQVVRSRGFAESLHGHEGGLAALTALAHLAPWRLVWLDAFDEAPPPGWLDQLPRFAHLEELVFTWVPPHVTPPRQTTWQERIECLLAHRAAEALTHLTRLGFVRMRLTDPWLVTFLGRYSRSAWAGRVRSLDLRRNNLTDAAANLLASARGLPSNFTLHLAGNRITPAGQELLRRRFGERAHF